EGVEDLGGLGRRRSQYGLSLPVIQRREAAGMAARGQGGDGGQALTQRAAQRRIRLGATLDVVSDPRLAGCGERARGRYEHGQHGGEGLPLGIGEVTRRGADRLAHGLRTCCLKWWATQSASAWIVDVGLTAAEVVQRLPSTT